MPSEWKLCFYLCFKYLSTNIRQANNIYGFLYQKSKIKPLKEVTLPPQFPTPTWMTLLLNLKKWESGRNVLMRNVINLYISKISYFKPSSGYLCSLRCNGLSFTSISFLKLFNEFYYNCTTIITFWILEHFHPNPPIHPSLPVPFGNSKFFKIVFLFCK